MSAPTSWSVPAWFVDPSNSTGLASDNNAGTSSGTPLLTKGEIINRWGTSTPNINGVNVVITYLSSDPNGGNDPGFFRPNFLNGASLTHQGALPASSFTGSLLAVTAKNRSANQALRSTFATSTGAIAANMMLVNTTRGNSRAFVQRNVSGGTWQLSQPMVPYTPPAEATFTEVDTWANGDDIIGYILYAIDLVGIGGQSVEIAAANGAHIIYQLTVQKPGTTIFDFMRVDGSAVVILAEIAMLRGLSWSSGGTIRGTITNSGLAGNYNMIGTTPYVQGPVIHAGFVGGTVTDMTGVGVFNDTMFSATTTFYIEDAQMADMFYDGAVTPFFYGDCLFSGGVHYGGGTLNTVGPSTYTAPAVTRFPVSGGLLLNGVATGYSNATSGGTVTVHGGIALTPTNLDAAAGAAGFGGYAYGGGAAWSASGVQP